MRCLVGIDIQVFFDCALTLKLQYHNNEFTRHFVMTRSFVMISSLKFNWQLRTVAVDIQWLSIYPNNAINRQYSYLFLTVFDWTFSNLLRCQRFRFRFL